MTDAGSSELRSAVRRSVYYGCVLVAIAILVTTPIAASTTSPQPTPAAEPLPAEPAFIVALDDDESARVTVTITFDLTTDSEREAFEAFRENTTAHERRTDQFATRMQAIAAKAENTTGRTMQIREPDIAFATQNETGIVALSVAWDGLAVREGDRLVLREPFADGFSTDRQVTIIGPDGYELTAVTPSPRTQNRNTATWQAGTEFDGFRVTFTPAESTPTATGDDTTGIGAPGFGIGAGIVALLGSTTLLVHRRRNQQ